MGGGGGAGRAGGDVGSVLARSWRRTHLIRVCVRDEVRAHQSGDEG